MVQVNGIYWDERFPRLLTKEQMRQLDEDDNRRLLAVADISCDVEGSIEFLGKSTTVERPYYEYDPITGEMSEDIIGDGVAMMGVDILPTELPRESSKHFGDALTPLMERLIVAKGSSDATSLQEVGNELPVELANACIANQGYLTPAFEYISEFLKKRDHAGNVSMHDPHILISLQVRTRTEVYQTGLHYGISQTYSHVLALSPVCFLCRATCLTPDLSTRSLM